MSWILIRITLIRHGESEGNKDSYAYVEKGDQRVGLTEMGWQQAVHAGKFLDTHFQETSTQTIPRTFVSSYERTKQTLRGVLSGLENYNIENLKIYEDPRLTEQNYGALAHLSHDNDPQKEGLVKAFLELTHATYKGTPFSATPPFGESPKEIMGYVKSFIDGTLARDIEEGKNDFLIVSHGAVMKAFIMCWFHLPMSSWKELKTPGNTDVYTIEGTPKNWDIAKIYDGQAGERVQINPIETINQLTVDTLPPLPDFLKKKL